MFKVRIPYSGIAALAGAAFGWSSLTVGCIGMGVELFLGLIILIKLRSESEFNYDSFFGQILMQYMILDEADLSSIVNLIMARIAGYIFIMFNVIYLTILGIALIIASCVHYLKSSS